MKMNKIRESAYLSLIIAIFNTVLVIPFVWLLQKDTYCKYEMIVLGLMLMLSGYVFWIWAKKGVCEQTADLKTAGLVYIFLDFFMWDLSELSRRGWNLSTIPYMYLFSLILFLILSIWSISNYVKKYYFRNTDRR